MSVVVMGYHNMGCLGIKALKKHKIPISAVITYHDNPKENIWFDSVAQLAESYGIKVYYADKIDNEKLFNIIKPLKPDVIFSFYYRDMIPERIFKIPKHGSVNLHGSLLPKYRGRCPVNWQIIEGETESGVTLHYIVKKADAGDIIGQKKVRITKKDTAKDLYGKLEKATEDLLNEKIDDIIKGTVKVYPQYEKSASIYGGRRPEDGRIDWRWTSNRIYNLVRAVTKPYPGAFSSLDNRKIIIWKVEFSSEEPASKEKTPGSIIEKNNALYAKTGDGWLRIVKFEVEDQDKVEKDKLALSGKEKFS